ncbi:MAG: hypothetical protein K2G41_00360 [Duncaniella sp.]|uniref:hypothetical protein n=1 Tax=Duncaniella sp. TaxID=2518496 RepID=UPI0023C965EE|nr:hypothetical protein [Duncaniella sp.]MDE6089131.1 hypothetical protein [Duncaniella sp.]
MAKRTVTRIGDIFCAEIDNEYKCYFQYVGKDSFMLGGALIRVFRKKYPLDANPDLTDVINGEIGFHTLTYIQVGTKLGAWYKVGKAPILNQEQLCNLIFGDPRYMISPDGTLETYYVNPFDHWFVRRFNEPSKDIGKLPDYLKGCIEYDGVHPRSSIIERMKYGYVIGSSFFYAEVKRKPWPETESFTALNLKRAESYTNLSYYHVYGDTAESVVKTDGEIHYFHFHGDRAIREIVVKADGSVIHLSSAEPKKDGYELFSGEFGDINWHAYDFLTRKAFDAQWEKG